jgi:uncharacterized Fe-S center protein
MAKNKSSVLHVTDFESFCLMLEEKFKKAFSGCKTIAIKIHFGELGNGRAFKPAQIKPITDLLKEMGFNYYLYDSSVSYPGPRSLPLTHKALAIAKGWGKLGEIRTNDDFIPVKGKKMEYQVCKELTDADGVLVISHVKGHVCTGFGGAIKNLGMGAVTKVSKRAIHDGGKPVFGDGCVLCGICVHNCPVKAMKITAKQPHPVVHGCYGCSNCAYVCPHEVIKPKVAYFDVLLADAATTAASKFKKAFYISYLINVAKECDCMPISTEIIGREAGYLACDDPVAIDHAAYDLICKESGEDIFLKHNKKSGLDQVEAAEKLGMGNSDYEIRQTD